MFQNGHYTKVPAVFIPNTKEEKCNLKKPGWGGFTTGSTHSKW